MACNMYIFMRLAEAIAENGSPAFILMNAFEKPPYDNHAD